MLNTDKNLQQCIMSFDEYFKDELQANQQPSAESSTPKAIDGKRRPRSAGRGGRRRRHGGQQGEGATSPC
jgi:hypothetical protein